MADIQSNINVNIDTGNAIESIKNLQRQISVFHQSLRSSGSAANAAISENMTRNLVNSINATKKFAASFTTVQSSTEAFTTALEKNKLSMGQYFKYAAGSTKSFGKLFATEFNTIQQVAESRVRTLQTQFIKLGRDAGGAVKAIKVRPLALDMENLATQTAIAAQKQQLFNQLIKQGSTNLLNFGKNTQWAGRQLMVGFTVPLTMLGSTASKVFMDMEKEIIKLKRVYGDFTTTAAETEEMVNQIKMLGSEFTKYGVAVSKTMGLAADAAAMGKTGADLLAQVEQANKLAVLGGVEQAQALETTISVTNAFGVAAEDLAGKINFLNAVENQTVTSIEDLTIAIPKAGPVIKQLGGSVEDLAFFLTAMKEGGINASEGANALKSGIASIINPTGKASEFLQGFGINLKSIVESNAGNAKNMIIGVAQALNTLDPLNRARAIEQLFGKFQFARISTLFQNITKEGTQASKVLELTRATSQELAILSERELKKVEDSPMFKFQKAIEDIKASLVPLGEQFLKLITPIIKFGSEMLEKFNAMGDGVKNFVMGAVAILGGLAPAAIMAFGLIANGIANIIKAGNLVRNVFIRMTQGTSVLGQQTQYMTSEQLEAAAAAASLDQAHQNLTQQFTVEETAVRRLIAAYNDAALAQERMAAAGVIGRGRGGKRGGATPPGYNNGVLSVPGPKGAGDIVPAMLAPGEAVIPADIASKNRGFIAQMMQDKLPGFRKGNVEVSSGRSITVGGETFIISQNAPQIELDKLERAAKHLYDTDPEVARLALKSLEGEKLRPKDNLLKAFAKKAMIWDGGLAGRSVPETLKIIFPEPEYAGKGALREDIRSALRGNPNTNSNVIDEVAKNPKLKKEFDLAQRMSKAQYEAIVNATGEDKAYYLKKMADKQKEYDAEFAKGKSPIRKVATIESMAANITGYDPKNPTARHGTERGHLLTAGVLKQDPRLWSSDFVAIDPRMENNMLSVLSGDNGKERTQIIFAAADEVSKKNPELKSTIDSLKNKISENAAFGEEERIAFSKITKEISTNKTKYTGMLPKGKAGTFGTFFENLRLLSAGYEAADLTNPKNRGYRTNTPQSTKAALEKTITQIKTEMAAFRSGIAMPKQLATSRMLKFLGFNKGVVSVPGPKGAGDVVPAMLTPGESVIPAKMSKKYAPLISAMVNDTVPGYEQGLFDDDPFGPSNYNFDDSGMSSGSGGWKEKGKALASGFGSKAMGLGKNLATGMGKNAGVIAQGIGNRLKDSTTNFLAKQASKLTGGAAYVEGANGRRFVNGVEERTDVNGNPYYVQEGKGRISRDAAMQNMYDPEEERAAKKQAKAEKKQRRQAAVGKFARGAGTTGMIASTVGMGMMMSGDPGMQQIGGGVMALGMIAPLLPMLANPIGAVVIGLAAVAGGFLLLKGHLDSVGESARKSAETLGVGTKAMDKYAEIAGKVSSTQLMDKRRAEAMSPFSIKAGKNTFGANALQSEMGKTLLSESKKAMLGGRDLSGILFRQLSAAVASNSLDVSQARSVAYAITEELGKQEVGMDVNAKLTAMFGPKGENLLKDPLKIQIQQIEQTELGLEEDFGVLQDNLDVTFDEYSANVQRFQTDTEKSLGFWADFGKRIDSALGVPNMLINWISGGKISGIIGGVTSAIGGLVKGAEDEVTAMNAYVVNVSNAIQNYQSSIDSLDAYYQKAIEAAKASGDMAKASELQIKYDLQRAKLMERYSTAMSGLVESFNNLKPDQQTKLVTASADRLAEKFKDDPDSKALYDQAAVNVKKFTGENQYQLNMLLNADAMTLSTFSWISTNLDNDQVTKVMNLRTVLSGKDLGTFTSLLSRFSKTGQANFIANFSTKDMTSGKAKELLSTYTEIANLADTIGAENGQQLMDFYADPKNINQLKLLGGTIKTLKEYDGEKITVDYIQNIEGGDKFAEIIKGNQQYFDSLDKNQQITYTQVVATLTLGDPLELEKDAMAWATAQGKTAGMPSYAIEGSKTYFTKQYINEMAEQRTEFLKAMGLFEEGGDTPEDTGAGPTNYLDDLLKKLKNVRQAAVDASGGLKELFKWMKPGMLEKKGGGLIFNGLEQQLDAKGLNKEFIDFVANADKATQNKLFTMKNGIVKLKAEGVAVSELFNQVAIGNYQRSVSGVLRTTKEELSARKELLASGMSYNDAVEAGRDANLAEAIAAIKASTTIQDKNAAIRDTIDLYKQQKAAAEEVKTAEEKFNDLYDKVQKKFDAESKKIEIDFELSVSTNKATVVAAQSDIETIRYSMDDYQAGLTRLEPLEEAINKKYEERKNALDKIREINDRIANQQRAQMTLAGALASGDIAAAARAAQEMKEQEANDAISERAAALEKARENELSSLKTSVNGVLMTRAEIETKIKDLEKQIFDIEELRLEPAQRQIDLAEELRDKKLAALDAEKLKWEELQNKIELAKTSAINYAEALKQAQALANQAVVDVTTPKPVREERTYDPTRGYFVPVSQARVNTGSVFYDEKDGKYYSSATGTTVATSYGVPRYAMGGIVPKYFAAGGFASGTDTVPAMLTPGEFVVKKYAVDSFGVDNLKAINSGTYSGDSMYNYSVNVNVRSDADPNAIARTVMDQIQRIDSQRIRSNKR